MSFIDGIVITRHYENDDCWVEVEEAAPRATFTASLLRRMRKGDTGAEFTLDRVPCIGAILRIRARNRTLVYQLIEYDQKHGTFTGVWPD